MHCRAFSCDIPGRLAEEEAVDLHGYPAHPECAEYETERREELERAA